MGDWGGGCSRVAGSRPLGVKRVREGRCGTALFRRALGPHAVVAASVGARGYVE